MTIRPVADEPRCEKGTQYGYAAMHSAYGFARCVLPAHHFGRCDSGEARQVERELPTDDLPPAA